MTDRQQSVMNSDRGESPAEAKLLATHANALLDALRTTVERWAVNTLVSRSPADAHQRVQKGADRIRNYVRESVLPDLTSLLGADIDAQWTSPLEIVRSLVVPITAELQTLDVPPPQRDASSIALHQDDLYNIAPATFADVDPSLHDLGLAWGAAKAHVHLRRHKEMEPDRVPVVVVCAPELGDRSRFDAFEVHHVRNAQKLAEFSSHTEPDLVIVDLDRTADPVPFRIDNAHVVGFGSHVDTERHDAALDAGYDAVMARSVFFRRLPELLAPVQKSVAP